LKSKNNCPADPKGFMRGSRIYFPAGIPGIFEET